MVRSCHDLWSRHGLRPLATGLALAAAGTSAAAPSPGETLNAAVSRELDAMRADANLRPANVEDAAAPRRLTEVAQPNDSGPGLSRSGVRPASDQQPQPAASSAADTAGTATKPQPSASQLEVMKQLEELYKRDGREMPSMRIKDAPNTYLPKERMPVKHGSTSESRTSNPQPVDSAERHSTANYSGLFAGNSGASARKPSFFDRLRGRGRSTSTTSKQSSGFFAKLLSPFRNDPKPHHLPGPAPAPLPEYSDPSNIAAQPLPDWRSPDAAPRRLESQDVADTRLDMPADAAHDSNPFEEVTAEADAGEMIMVIKPSHTHPLDDAFAEVRGEAAPEISFVAAVDPAFVDDNAIDMTAPRTLESPAMVEGDAFAPVTPEAAPVATSQQAAAARYAELQRKLAERSGLGGFQGFCPVALRDRRELVDARPEFLSIYQGRTYELASAESKARFEADPQKYAPVNLGNDLVLVSRGEPEAEGNLNFAVWFKDRLYLFRSSETLREFNANPTKYALAD